MADELETHIAFLPGETKCFFGLWSPMGTEVMNVWCMCGQKKKRIVYTSNETKVHCQGMALN